MASFPQTQPSQANGDDALMDTIRRLTDEVQALRGEMERLQVEADDRFRLLAHWVQQGDSGGTPSHRFRSAPIFVLGCVRSGTSTVGMALQKAGLPGWREGHIFPLLYNIKETIDTHFDREKAFLGSNWGIDLLCPTTLERLLADHFERLHTDNLMSMRWVDKTPGPEMIEAAPYLLSLWPEARFVFCRRRGIENVKSQLRRFGKDPAVNRRFAEACHVWARSMEMWLGVREKLGSSFIEIDQADLAADPQGAAKALGAFLNLTPTQTEAVHVALRDDFPEQTATSYAWESLEETGWTQEEQNLFFTACGTAMAAYGYPLGGDFDKRAQRMILLSFTDDPERVTLTDATIPDDYKPAEPGVFMLHPRMEGPPPVVTFKALPFNGHTLFHTKLEIRHPQAQPVLFSISISDCKTGAVFVSEHMVVYVGESEWKFEFPPLTGSMDVHLSTEMAPGSSNNFFAWAHWISPRFIS